MANSAMVYWKVYSVEGWCVCWLTSLRHMCMPPALPLLNSLDPNFGSTFHVQFLASTRGSVQKKVCEPTRGISQRMILQSWVGPVWGRSSSTFECTRTILARTHPSKIFQQDSCQQSSRFCRKFTAWSIRIQFFEALAARFEDVR